MGATPETLLKVNRNKFQTVALAGTQLYKGSEEVIWQNKEKDEQQYVTDYIVEILSKSVCEIQISTPKTIKAGNLLHLKTEIQGIIHNNTNLRDLVLLLHPTPAVCGLPQIKAVHFINKDDDWCFAHPTYLHEALSLCLHPIGAVDHDLEAREIHTARQHRAAEILVGDTGLVDTRCAAEMD